MANSGVPILPLAVIVSGGILLYSGVVNQPISTVLRNTLKGNATGPNYSFPQPTSAEASSIAQASSVPTQSGPIQTVTSIQNFGLAGLVAASYTWPPGTQEFAALTQVINMESGGNPNIFNGAGSGAYGIAQALGHGTASTGGTATNQYGPLTGMNLPNSTYVGANSGNATDQLIWMCSYIQITYGDPIKAYDFHLTNNYY